MTFIKSQTRLNFGQIGPLTTELAALEHLNNFPKTYMFFHASSFISDRIIIKVAGNQDRHKSSVEFDFGPNQTTHFGLIMGKYCLHATTFIFDRIIIKVAGNQDMHKSSDEFDFGPD